MNGFVRDFQYYRLSLFAYALSSLLEVMLSGNFSEENISERKAELENYSSQYTDLYSLGAKYLEDMSKKDIGVNTLKGLGNAGKALGKFLSGIPGIQDGYADELLQDHGQWITDEAKRLEQKAVQTFSIMSDSQTKVFTEDMEKMIQIYDHTSDIYIDRDNVYLVSD